MDYDQLELLEESSIWHSRNVRYWSGSWERIRELIPTFELRDFKDASDAPSNPYLRSVVRMPAQKFEQAIPVGIVSNSYTLAQHRTIAEQCLVGLTNSGVDVAALRCELGLSELGEWMNFRVYLSDDYQFVDMYGEELGLRLECFNSVDGSSRLVILFGWLRFVCTNGLVIGETKIEIRDIHNQSLDITKIPGLIADAMVGVEVDRKRISSWETTQVAETSLKDWVDGYLSEQLGKKAACRILHICATGHDVELADPFAKGLASEKPVNILERVPGMPEISSTLYDVSQALSWIATQRNNAEERLAWQSKIPSLIDKLAA